MAPTAVTAQALSCQSVTVHWTPPTNNEGIPLMGYSVRYDADKEQTIAGNVTSVTIEGLRPNTTYSITVVARNTIGEGTESPALSVTTEPRQGTFVSVRALKSDTITIETTQGEVERYANISCSIPNAPHKGPYTPPVNVTHLQPDTYYTLVCDVYNSSTFNPCVNINTSVLTSESGLIYN